MSWNYRVLAFAHPSEVVFEICPVYYSDSGKPNGYGKGEPVYSDTGKEGLVWRLQRYDEALLKPILYAGDRFPEEYNESGSCYLPESID